MRREDAPPPGWYPDPTGGSQLWWWDGLDWTDHRRAPLTRSAYTEAQGAADEEPVEALQRESARLAGQARTALSREDRTEMIAEVRKVAREEVDRAVDRVTDRARSATRDLQPLISEYGAKLMKWIRILGIIAIALLVLWMVLQTFGQASLLDWIGDRIDNLTGGQAMTGGQADQFVASGARHLLG